MCVCSLLTRIRRPPHGMLQRATLVTRVRFHSVFGGRGGTWLMVGTGRPSYQLRYVSCVSCEVNMGIAFALCFSAVTTPRRVAAFHPVPAAQEAVTALQPALSGRRRFCTSLRASSSSELRRFLRISECHVYAAVACFSHFGHPLPAFDRRGGFHSSTLLVHCRPLHPSDTPRLFVSPGWIFRFMLSWLLAWLTCWTS